MKPMNEIDEIMSLSDLNDGDWIICYEDAIAKIDGIFTVSGGIWLAYACIDNKYRLETIREVCDIHDILPIPLTIEMLRKNGFSNENTKDGRFIKSDSCIIVKPKEFYSYEVFYHGKNRPMFKLGTIKYVHELQHYLSAIDGDENFEIEITSNIVYNYDPWKSKRDRRD